MESVLVFFFISTSGPQWEPCAPRRSAFSFLIASVIIFNLCVFHPPPPRLLSSLLPHFSKTSQPPPPAPSVRIWLSEKTGWVCGGGVSVGDTPHAPSKTLGDRFIVMPRSADTGQLIYSVYTDGDQWVGVFVVFGAVDSRGVHRACVHNSVLAC